MHIAEQDYRDLEIIYRYLVVHDTLPEHADALVVGGAGPRTDMAERAVELYHQGAADVIVFSGFTHPDFDENEAELLTKVAIEKGVPAEAIVTEPLARNTGLNIILAAQALVARGIVAKNIILIHRPFMTRRFKATAEKQWPDPKPTFYVTSVADSFREYLARDEKLGLAQRMITAMLGDYVRIVEYAKLGYQTPQPPAPEEADAAFLRLEARGFMAKPQDDTLSTKTFTLQDDAQGTDNT